MTDPETHTKQVVQIDGLYHDDLFRVDISTPEQEVADARKQFKELYPTQNAVFRITRLWTE